MKRRLILFLALSFGLNALMTAQTLGIDALEDGYPLLMKKFRNEVEQQRADYFFLIDVSGSMNKYQDIVVPSLNEFFSSLQDGDYVDVIHFGAEAEPVNGCYGTIDRKKVQSLTNNTNQIYFEKRPSDPVLREKFWDYTDLDNAMHTLAKEMHQLGLHDLKFVFVITDFEHDPSAARNGKEDWSGVKQQLEHEQSQSFVNVITLQLPGNSTHLKQVRECLPAHFAYQNKAIADGSDLASWFTRLKNNIMHDRFKAIVSKKVQDAKLQISPEIDINGNMDLTVTWQPNELFDDITINTLSTTDTELSIENFTPLMMRDSNARITGLKLNYEKTSIIPAYFSINCNVVATASYADSLVEEVQKLLDSEIAVVTASAPMNRKVFFHPLSLRQFIIVLLIIICYLIISIWALVRNGRYTLKGKMYVDKISINLTETKSAENKKSIEIGRQGSFLRVEDCRWKMRIYVKTTNAFIPILHLKGPVVKVAMVEGAQFKVNGTKYASDKSPAIVQFSNISVDEYHIHWIHN